MADDTEVEITIETLTGTIYELRISIFETILGIKARIQRLEGLSVHQQVLVYNNQVLRDDACLLECGISSGSRLQLLLAMRGGPIQTTSILSDEGNEARYEDDDEVVQLPFVLFRGRIIPCSSDVFSNRNDRKSSGQTTKVPSRPSTQLRREREVMQAKVDKLKGQMREIKRWRSQQHLPRRRVTTLEPQPDIQPHRSFEHLPKIDEARTSVTTQLEKKKKRQRRLGRCDECGRKTGITSAFPCRCGGSFCSKHRYAEMHDCTFDYKKAGKVTLAQENPVVTAPKLPKI